MDELIGLIYLLRDRLYVQQVVQCTQCHHTGLLYLDMSYVHEDTVQDVECVWCKSTEIRVITFELMQETC